MFTGIVTAVGRIRALEKGRDARRFEIVSAYDPDTIAIGASIAHAGACLTVVDRGPAPQGAWHAVEASEATLAATTLGEWTHGQPINLERALRAGDELGGHLVSGHVDGVGEVRARDEVAGSIRFRFAAPATLARFLAAKGSITVDGVSLTVNEVDDADFHVNIIPHTAAATTLGALTLGRRVNLEIDQVARYLARLIEVKDPA